MPRFMACVKCFVLTEPIIVTFDTESLTAVDTRRFHQALGESHLVTIHTPKWSAWLRHGNVTGIEIHDLDNLEITERMALLGTCPVWGLLAAFGIEVRRVSVDVREGDVVVVVDGSVVEQVRRSEGRVRGS